MDTASFVTSVGLFGSRLMSRVAPKFELPTGGTPPLSTKNGLSAKAARRGYVVLGICFGMPLLLATSIVIIRPDQLREVAPVIVIAFSCLLTVFVWLSAFRLHVGEGELRYRTLFSGERRVNLADVTAVQQVLDFNPWENWGRPRDRLEIYSHAEDDLPYVCINLKVFRRQDVQKLLEILGPRLERQ